MSGRIILRWGRGRLRQEEQGRDWALQEREHIGSVYHRLAVEAEQVQGKAASLRQRVARIEADLDRARRRREAQGQAWAWQERELSQAWAPNPVWEQEQAQRSKWKRRVFLSVQKQTTRPHIPDRLWDPGLESTGLAHQAWT